MGIMTLEINGDQGSRKTKSKYICYGLWKNILLQNLEFLYASISRYEVADFEKKIVKLYAKIEPLYKQLHAYVRRKLFQKYGKVSDVFQYY
jgi:hypothetical protein